MTPRLFSPANYWPLVVGLTLMFWLGATLVLDLLVMPGLYWGGLMHQTGFTSFGYLVFGWFNHAELLLAALIMTSVLAQSFNPPRHYRWGLVLAGLLVGITLLYTYVLTPWMGETSLMLNWLTDDNTVPAQMKWLHGGYFALETLKVLVGGALLWWQWRYTLAN
ncbi:MAG: hypothetical protein RMI89_01035 [Gloeomargarita sp. SKYBB_i_bin120]|nr:hypothetical protein [Gloeomargarita sp. SKYG98]MCS7291546.1 hypothetical protein [Gloeomargarita sp. SKYB120]MDW8177106.1 hypothetical protein [Gloeomargarita sp. SKYBB_i_bin120]